MTDIIIQGISGRMGKSLCELIAQRNDCRVVAGVDVNTKHETVPVYAHWADVKEHADVLIDFSTPAASMETISACANNSLPCVICTTGFSDEELNEINNYSKKTAIFMSGNMSLGINLLQTLITKAQSILKGFDIEIIEKHHNKKVDAPSGTALMLANTLNEAADFSYNYVYDRHNSRKAREKQEIGISAVRGGSIVGEHEVIFAGPDETISISHSAFSRDVFANGAISAALFMKGKSSGCFNMTDVFNSIK